QCYSFFFQAEDGIRDFHVTGVQTCALPIYRPPASPSVICTSNDSCPTWSFYKISSISLWNLASGCDGSSNTCQCLPPFCNDGKGRAVFSCYFHTYFWRK